MRLVNKGVIRVLNDCEPIVLDPSREVHLDENETFAVFPLLVQRGCFDLTPIGAQGQGALASPPRHGLSPLNPHQHSDHSLTVWRKIYVSPCASIDELVQSVLLLFGAGPSLVSVTADLASPLPCGLVQPLLIVPEGMNSQDLVRPDLQDLGDLLMTRQREVE